MRGTALADAFKLNTQSTISLTLSHEFPGEKTSKNKQNDNDAQGSFHLGEILGGLLGLGNDFLFELRKRLPDVRRRAYREELPSGLRQSIQMGMLRPEQAFALSESALKQNLIYGEALKQIQIPHSDSKIFRALDIGSRHFVYAPVLSRWVESQVACEKIEIVGIEVDPYVFYFDFYRRGDLGRYYASVASSAVTKVSYETGDWLDWPQPNHYDLITCFFPYLSRSLHQQDRLPRRSFNPLQCYEKIFQATNFVVFFHQGEREACQSLDILSRFPQVRILQQFALQDTAYGRRKTPLYAVYAQV